VVDLQLDSGFRLEFALGNMGRIRRVGSKPKARFYWGFCKGRVWLMTFSGQADDFLMTFSLSL